MPTKLEGGESLRKALKGFTTDLSSFIYQEMDTLFAPIIRNARGFIPSTINLSGWQEGTQKGRWEYRAWNRNEAVAGIGYSVKPSKPNRSGFVSLARIVNASAAGAIYETAGLIGPQPWVGPKAGGATKKVSRSNWEGAGAQFISNLGPLTPSLKGSGRLIFKAWSKNRGVAEGAAMKAIDKTTMQFEQRAKGNRLRSAA